MPDLRDVPPRPTYSCGHPVSPNPTTDEVRLHVEHVIEQRKAEHGRR
jgi:hypothetical protein